MLACFIPQSGGLGNRLLNLAKEEEYALTGTTPSSPISSSTSGMAQFGFSGNAGGVGLRCDTGLLLAPSASALTAAASCKPALTATRNNLWGNTTTNTGGRDWFFRAVDHSPDDLNGGYYNGSGYVEARYTTSGQYTNLYHNIAMRFSPTIHDVWSDGVIVATGTGTSQTFDMPVSFMFATNNGDSFQGTVEAGWLWNRALSDDELRLLNERPWEMLLPETRRHFFIDNSSEYAFKIREGGTSSTTAQGARNRMGLAASGQGILAGTGLTGGGTLSKNPTAVITIAADTSPSSPFAFAATGLTASEGVIRTSGTTLAVAAALKSDIPGLTEDTIPDVATDFVMTYDSSASAHKKVKLTNLPAGTVVGGSNATYTGAAGSEPAGIAGDLYFPNNGFAIQRYAGGWGHTWGPVYPLNYPPAAASGVSTTLNGGINNSVTALTLTSASGFPSAPYTILIGTEEIRVTASSGTTVSAMTRGWDGTTAASHSNGDTITLLNWEWVNQGSATVTQTTNNGIYMSTPAASGVSFHSQVRPIGSFTSVRGMLLPSIGSTTTTQGATGLVLRESSSGKVCIFMLYQTSQGNQLYVQYGTSFTAITTTPLSAFLYQGNVSPLMMRIDPTATNMLFYVSSDGANWWQIHSLAKATPFSSVADQWGYAVQSNSATWGANATLISWTEQ
jgi:hypothetical protein